MTGWLIGVMVETEGEAQARRHFFAVGHDDRAKAEWSAIDRAMLSGRVATSPVGGLEPVHTLLELSPRTIGVQALRAGEVRALGWRWPRPWVPAPVKPKE